MGEPLPETRLVRVSLCLGKPFTPEFCGNFAARIAAKRKQVIEKPDDL